MCVMIVNIMSSNLKKVVNSVPPSSLKKILGEYTVFQLKTLCTLEDIDGYSVCKTKSELVEFIISYCIDIENIKKINYKRWSEWMKK